MPQNGVFLTLLPYWDFKKKHHFGPWAATRKKIIEVQDKKREKMGILGDFRGFFSEGANGAVDVMRRRSAGPLATL